MILAGIKDMHKSLKGLHFGTFKLLTLELIGPGQLLSYLKTIQNILIILGERSLLSGLLVFVLLFFIFPSDAYHFFLKI